MAKKAVFYQGDYIENLLERKIRLGEINPMTNKPMTLRDIKKADVKTKVKAKIPKRLGGDL